MKKLVYFIVFLLFLSGTVVFSFSSGILQIINLSGNELSLELYNKFSSTPSIPVFAMAEVTRQVDQIPVAMKPYLKMIIEQMPRPKNGVKIRIGSEIYTLYFKREGDWRMFKRTMLKLLPQNKVPGQTARK